MTVIVAALRTPIGKFCGGLASVTAADLGGIVIKALLEKVDCSPDIVDEVIMGNVLQAGQGQGPARQAALKAGLPVTVPATTINNICGSGLKSINLAVAMIESGQADVIVAGGMENMSLAPYLLAKARGGYRIGNGELIDSMTNDGLIDAFDNCHMGITAERVANKYSISREHQDEFAALSQQKVQRALAENRFKDEIVPVTISSAKRGDQIIDTDEYPRAGVTADSIAGLAPAFQTGGSVTAANSSGLNDGAAALLLMSKQKAQALGLEVMAEVVGTASTGVDPAIMGIGPVSAITQALQRANLSLQEIDLLELNEAFAAQALAVSRELGLEQDRVNVNGGAIALGHPIGASGARILVTLLHAMQKQQAALGLASLCVGGGMGIATIVRRAMA